MENLTPIRCPLKVISKKGYTFVCGRSCLSVAPGSKGEVYCSSCKQTFIFEVSSQYMEPKREIKRIEVQREQNTVR